MTGAFVLDGRLLDVLGFGGSNFFLLAKLGVQPLGYRGTVGMRPYYNPPHYTGWEGDAEEEGLPVSWSH